MSDVIIVALISGLVTLIGTGATVLTSNRKTARTFETAQAVMEEKVANLTDEVRKHNGFATRMPVLEEKLENIERRLSKLEAK